MSLVNKSIADMMLNGDLCVECTAPMLGSGFPHSCSACLQKRKPQMKRYYLSRRAAQPEGGVWKIFDRVLDIRIASCDFKENAELIVSALNHDQSITIRSIDGGYAQP